MDMGFWPDVQKIMTALPPDRQTLLFSATLPGEIQRMAKEMNGRRATYRWARRRRCRTIDHQKVDVERDTKIDWLASFAKRDADGPVLVFVRRKVDADRVTPPGGESIVPRRCTRIDRSRNGCRRWRASARASIPCWSRLISPRVVSTSKGSRTSSISKCRIHLIPTCTGSDARDGRAHPATR